MEWKKAKWLIISLLLAVNIFLGFNIAYKYTRAISSEKNSLLYALSTADTSFGFSEELFASLPRYLYSYTGVRDIDAESNIANNILHGDIQSSEAGGVFSYSNANIERIYFRRGGSIAGIVSFDEKINIINIIAEYAKDSGLNASVNSGQISFMYQGIPISNAYCTETVYGEHTSISGLVPISSGWQRENKGRSRGEMVLALKNIITDNSLGSLSSVQAVYYTEASGGKTLLLTPAWQVQCKNGSFTVSLIDKSLLESSFK